jgi:hypothetical protein
VTSFPLSFIRSAGKEVAIHAHSDNIGELPS